LTGQLKARLLGKRRQDFDMRQNLSPYFSSIPTATKD